MKKTVRIVGIFLGILVAVYLLVLLGLQLFLNSRKARSIVEDVAAEALDANLSFSRLRFNAFSSFPCFRLTLEDVSLTYPHSRFAKWDVGSDLQGTLFEYGSGSEADTLAAFSSFTVAINPYPLINGKIRLKDANIHALRLYAHSYPTNGTAATANWQIFHSRETADSLEQSATLADAAGAPVPAASSGAPAGAAAPAPLSLPNVKLGPVSLTGSPLIVYSSLKDTVCAYLGIDRFLLQSPSENSFDLGTDMNLQAWTSALNGLHIPISINTLLSYNCSGDTTTLNASKLNLTLAQISTKAKAGIQLLSSTNNLSATLQMQTTASESKLQINGNFLDLLSQDPWFSAHIGGEANIGELSKGLIADSLLLSGLVDLSLDAKANLSELKDFQFNKGTINARLSSPDLSFSAPGDTLSAGLKGLLVELNSGKDGISAIAQMDTVLFAQAEQMKARIRHMSNRADITKVLYKGSSVPRISFTSNSARIYLRSGVNRLGTRDFTLSANLQKRVRRPRNRAFNRPNAFRPTIYYTQADTSTSPHRRPFAQAAHDDFSDKDVRLDLGENVVNFLKEWSPSAGVSAGSTYIISPSLPLRNRINALDLYYNDDSFSLNTLQLLSGTSDLSFTGNIKGLRRTLLGKGFLRAELNANSSYLNLNEFFRALELGKNNSYVPKSETDESFVTDTLSNAEYAHSGEMAAFVIPANLNASVSLHVDKLKYSDLSVTPFDATLNASKRCVQLTDTRLCTNLGNIELDAFYATHSKKDIQIGADLQLLDMPAANIIHMLPTVDQMVPALKSFQGNLGCRISLTSQLDTNLNVLFPSLHALLKITGRDLKVTDAGKFRTITRLLLFKDVNIGHIDDLELDAIVENNQIEIYPFVLGVDKYKLGFMGVQGLNKAMRYNVSILRAPIFPIRFGINVFGTLDDFRFSIGRSKYRKGEVPVFTREIDDIHYNLGDAIKRVFERGVDGALAATTEGYSNLKKRKEELGYDNSLPYDFLSNYEYQQFEAAMFEEEMKIYNEQVDAEVEAALAESVKI